MKLKQRNWINSILLSSAALIITVLLSFLLSHTNTTVITIVSACSVVCVIFAFNSYKKHNNKINLNLCKKCSSINSCKLYQEYVGAAEKHDGRMKKED